MMDHQKSSGRIVFLVVVIFALLLPACTPADSQDQRIRQVEDHLLFNQTIQDRMAFHSVPGLSIAVVNDFELEWAKAYGVLELGKDEPVTVDTLFQAGSVAKPVTAVTALHYVEAGLIGLDQDVNEKLISWQIPENEYTSQAKVTLRELVSHTAGINQGLNRGYAPGEDVPTLLQALEGEPPANTLPVRVDRLPGTESYYSNGGYLVIVQLLEDLLDQPFTDITRQTIFDPLGMDSSSYLQVLPEELQARTATPHGWDINTWSESPGLIAETHIHDPGYGGLWTTAPDLAKFGIEFMKSYQGESNQILSREMAREVMVPVFENVPMQAPYRADIGLGFDLLQLGGETWLIHFGGSFPGYISVLLFQPDRGFGVAILTNSFTGYELIWEILYSVFYAYGIFPTTGQVLQMVFSALLFLTALIILPDWSRVGKKENGRQGWFNRIFLLLSAASAAVVTFRFRGPWGGYGVHPLWKGAPWVTKLLLGTFFTAGIYLVIMILLIWIRGSGSLRERVQITLLALGVLVGMFLLRDLWSVMFWG